MGTAYIETTITAEACGVTLFEADCVAEIDYETDRGALADWSIRDFRFDLYEPRWNQRTAAFDRVKKGEVWCPNDDLRKVLISYADKAHLAEKLEDLLHVSGELTHGNAALRADHHAAVL